MKSSLHEHLAAVRRELAEQRRAEEEKSRKRRVGEEQRNREAAAFREATRGVTPLPAPARVIAAPPRVAPIARMHQRDEAEALAASLSEQISTDTLIDTDDALSFARDGVGPATLRKLRRGQWVVQAQLDLHGLTREEARAALYDFLHGTVKSGKRCVRVVHGKGLGSKNRTPVLKVKVRHWLMQSAAVLAFTQARGEDGGAGALIVLLRSSAP
jgi:DNA-nicking Smr family endonuclease